jgi:hypothetical protein
LAQVIVVGGVIAWIIAVPSAVAFGYVLLHGLRVFRQIALVLCIGSIVFAPASPGPLWLIAFPVLGLILLLLPVSREFCISNSTTELV